MFLRIHRAWPLALAALLALSSAACRDEITQPGARPTPTTTRILGTITCDVDLQTGASRCTTRPASGGPAHVIITDPQVSELQLGTGTRNTADSTYTLPARIRNMGRNDLDFLGGDGTTATGIDLFLQEPPLGWVDPVNPYLDEGLVWSLNHDGTKRFNGYNQAYWHWPDMLSLTQTTSWRNLTFKVMPQVTSLHLVFNVSAQIPADYLGPKVVAVSYPGVLGGIKPGVVGPAVEINPRFPGDTVYYRFTAAPGYENVEVVLDGQLVADSGSFVIDSTHVLEASADSIYVLPSSGQALVTARRAILTATDKPAAYQAYLNAVSSLAGSVGSEEAGRIADLAEFQAIDPVTDYAALLAEDAALANHSFDLGSFSSSGAGGGANARMARSRSMAGLTGPAPADTTVFYYINGIMTDKDDARQAKEMLQGIISATPPARPMEAVVKLFYNRTYRDQLNPDGERDQVCLADAFRSGPFLGRVSMYRRWARCKGIAIGNYGVGDLWESARQVVELRYDIGSLPEDAALFADSITHYANLGHKVIIFPHSQGNLMTQQAVAHMRDTDTSWDDTRPLCVGAVSLASPLSDHWFIDETPQGGFRRSDVKPVLIAGDIIYTLLNQNHWDQIYTEDSIALQEALAWTAFLPEGPLRKLAEQPIYLYWGLRIHKVKTSYFARSASLTWIRANLISLHDGLTRRCGPGLQITPEISRMARGDSAQLQAQRMRPNLASQPTDSVHWRSLTPAVATVSAAGMVKAVGVGTARIVVESLDSTVADTTQFQTFDPRGIVGSWTGTWNNGDRYNQAFTTGPITLTVAGDASSASGVLSLSWRNGLYTGIFPEYRTQNSPPYSRNAWGAITSEYSFYNLLNVAEVRTQIIENASPRGYMILRVRASDDGMTATGSLTECNNWQLLNCYFPYDAPVGSIQLQRIP